MQTGGSRADAAVLSPEQPSDGSNASVSFSFRTDTLTMAGDYTVCAEYVETRDHLTRARSLPGIRKDPCITCSVADVSIHKGAACRGKERQVR